MCCYKYAITLSLLLPFFVLFQHYNYCTAMASDLIVKRILVTGANKGIGKAICERLLSEWDDTCVILGSRDQARGEKAIEEIKNAIGVAKCQDRLELLVIDTSSTSSVDAAADTFSSSSTNAELYGIINNAGIGWGHTTLETINTNYFGPRRVNDAFSKFLKRPGGRIVNVGSAAASNYVQDLPDTNENKDKLTKPWLIAGGIAEVDDMARSLGSIVVPTKEGYGSSKALLHAYTALHAKMETDLLINAVTPGFIQTDLTAGFGATKSPSDGAMPPCWLMMDTEFVPQQPHGRYYGSDCVRSPLHFYRGPGEDPYINDDDMVELPQSAKDAVTLKV